MDDNLTHCTQFSRDFFNVAKISHLKGARGGARDKRNCPIVSARQGHNIIFLFKYIHLYLTFIYFKLNIYLKIHK